MNELVLMLHSSALALSVISGNQCASDGRKGWALLCYLFAVAQIGIVAIGSNS